MRVLVACEFSGTVRRAFAARGHDAWSCDLLPAEDRSNHHIVGDARDLLEDIKPDVVHVLAQGRIVKNGARDLALQLEEEGYGPILREAGLETSASDEALQVPKGPDLDAEGDPDREPVEAAR